MKKKVRNNWALYKDQDETGIKIRNMFTGSWIRSSQDSTFPRRYSATGNLSTLTRRFNILIFLYQAFLGIVILPVKHLRVACTVIFLMAFSAVHGQTIQNDVFWKDTDGNPIYSQGGGVLKVGDKYYWYGAKYRGAITYFNDPYSGKNGDIGFIAITCYSSTDLVNWKNEGDVLRASDIPHGIGWLGRVGIAYNQNTRQYVLISQLNEGILFATNSSPTGQFTFRHTQESITNVVNDMSGDQSVFTDDDGQAYLIYCNRKGRSYQYVSRLRPSDYLYVEPPTNIYRSNGGREGNVMFKHKGTYYFITSDLHGWNTSQTYVATATNIFGPYTPEVVMEGTSSNYSHVTQCGLAVQVNGTSGSFVIFGGDRWADFAGNGVGYNQWVPITFDGTKPIFHSLSQWNINENEGTWSVGTGNNYVMNPAIEADRVNRTGGLVGWNSWTNLSSGNPNGNTQGSHFPGRFALSQWYDGAYQASLFQDISLPNATYTLTAWVRSSGGQNRAYVYVKDYGGSQLTYSINEAMGWTEITIRDINVTNGTIEVGVFSDANGGNWINADDFTLIQTGGRFDCAGVRNGEAELDDCGVCVGGNTGKAPCSAVIQGEDFCSAQGIMASNHSGFIGSGFVDFDMALGSNGTWNLVAQSAATANIGVRYANSGTMPRSMNISVNGTQQAVLAASPTGSWTSWTTELIILNLTKGPNIIQFTATTSEGGPNIDLFALTDSQLSAGSCVLDCNGDLGGIAFEDSCGSCVGGNTEKTACVQDCFGDWGGSAIPGECGLCVGGNSPNLPCIDSLEAEIACTVDGILSESTNPGFSGTGYVNTNNTLDASVSWMLNGTSKQTATLTFRYANGGSSPRDGQVFINGTAVATVSMPFTGNWTTWKVASVNVPLESGVNSVMVSATTGQGLGNIDLVYYSAGVSEEQCIVTGITNNSNTPSQTVYPTPTNGEVNWTGPQNWILVNSLGKEMATGKGSSADLTAYPAGVYFLKLGEKTYPVVKE